MMSLFRTPMENKEDKYKTDIRFVRYFLFKIIYLQEDGLSPNDIYNICLNEYGNKMSHKSLIEHVENSFMYEKGKFYLSEGQTYNYKNLLIVQHLFYYFQNKGIEKIKYELKIMLNSYSKDINVLLSLVFALNNILNNKPDDYYFMIALDIIVNLNDYYREMDYIINDLPDNIHSKLPDLILSQDIIEILDSVGVKSIETLEIISI